MEDCIRPYPPLITFVEKIDTLIFDSHALPVHTRGLKWIIDNQSYGIWKIAGDDAEDVGKLGKVLWIWYLIQRYPIVRLYYQVRRRLRDLRLYSPTEACQLED